MCLHVKNLNLDAHRFQGFGIESSKLEYSFQSKLLLSRAWPSDVRSFEFEVFKFQDDEFGVFTIQFQVFRPKDFKSETLNMLRYAHDAKSFDFGRPSVKV